MCDNCRTDPWFDQIEAFLEQWPQAEWGPGHCVFSDFNTDEYSVQTSLCDAQSIKAFMEMRMPCTEKRKQQFEGDAFYLKQEIEDCIDELSATIGFLKYMLAHPKQEIEEHELV